MINISKHVRFTFCGLALLAVRALAQSADPAQQPPAPAPAATPNISQDNTPTADATVKTPRYAFGVRVEYFPERFFQTQYVTINTINPILSTGSFGTSAGSKMTLGLTGEFRLNRRVFLGVDFFRHQEEYTQLSQIKSGLPDPNSSYDNRPLTTVTQDTRADYWDVPLVVRYYGLRNKAPRGLGWLAQAFVLGGGAYRHVSNIRTGTSTSEPDGSTSYNEIPAKALRSNLIGATGGFGYKVFEYGKFKAMAEGRYTRWFGTTFQGPSYVSQKNQVEIGLSFTY